jgi:hypothetical protein
MGAFFLGTTGTDRRFVKELLKQYIEIYALFIVGMVNAEVRLTSESGTGAAIRKNAASFYLEGGNDGSSPTDGNHHRRHHPERR